MSAEGAEVPPLHLSTEHVPERDRVAVWREEFGRRVLRLDIEPMPNVPFHGDVKLRSLAGVGLASASFSGTRERRTRDLLSDGNDAVALVVNVAGPFIASMRDAEHTLGAGDALAVSLGETGTFIRPSLGCAFGAIIPRTRLLPLVAGLDDSLGRLIPRDTNALRLLAGYLTAFEHTDSKLTPELQGTVATHVCDLVALTIGATRDGAALAQSRGLRAARLAAIKADIAENLGRADLAVAAVAQRHRLTPRHLHRLFEAEGLTYSEFVLGLRPARAHRMLNDPRYSAWTIKAIAFEFGFGDRSYFNRAFRRRYGVSPSDLRGSS
jgi:AraC-like DNA-binding protein